MDQDASARKAIRQYVHSGFYEADEIIQFVTDSIYWEDARAPEWIPDEVEGAIRAKLDEEGSWPEVTDCDRLDAAFEEMGANGLVAIQNAGYTQSDALSDTSEIYRKAGGAASGYDGDCYYHGQDLERVMECGELYLGYGAFDGDDEKGTEVGNRIKGILERAGFTVEWDGNVKTRLLVTGINWQRRGP